MKIRTALRDHSQSICFALAAIVILIFSQRTIFAPIPPSGDGQGYVMRGFALYGYLHTGQWAEFWHLLDRPNQSICPLHYLPFFILPQALTGTASYVLAQNLITYLLLAAAIFQLCRILNRAEWAPAIFLLCCVNNVGLTDYYTFYLDMEFFALGLFVVALQVTAWREKGIGTSILSGVGLGLLFWMKPANALIFLAVFILSEVFRGAADLLASKSSTDRRPCLVDSLRRWGYQGLGFLPLLLVAFFCGGAQTVVQLIHANEINDAMSPLSCDILLRVLYFPLCLSYFYHALLLGGFLLAIFLLNKKWPLTGNGEGVEFPNHLFIPLALSCLVWGELFSFWMETKTMRSLLPMLPLFWIAFYWLAEKRRLRIDLLFFTACAYSLLAFSQKVFDLVGTRSSYIEDTYQLSFDSWGQLPSPWFRGPNLNAAICDGLGRSPPPPGIICVNSIELQKDLTWRLAADDLLHGKQPRYQVRIIFNYKGTYLNQTFVGANFIIFKAMTGSQAETPIGVESTDILQYGIDEWVTNKHWAQPGDLTVSGAEPVGYLFFFPHALTQAQVDLTNQSEPFTGMTNEKDTGSVPLEGPHFSRAEAWQLIKAWYDKRTGNFVPK